MIRHYLSIVLLFLSFTCAQAAPHWIKLDSVETVPSTPEGVWRIAAGTIFRIEARNGQNGVYDLSIVQSADLSVPTGAYFGTMTTGADRHTFDARLVADPKVSTPGGKRNMRQFVLTFDRTFANLKIKHYRKGVTVNIFRLVPYLFRASITRHNDNPDGTVGATRCDATAQDYPVKL